MGACEYYGFILGHVFKNTPTPQPACALKKSYGRAQHPNTHSLTYSSAIPHSSLTVLCCVSKNAGIVH